jgi:hypothetical protein
MEEMGGKIMSDEKNPENGRNGIPSGEELGRMLDRGEWDKVKALLAGTPEEAEQILRESEWIDIDEVNRMLGITDEEIRASLAAPRPERFPKPKKDRQNP